MRVRIAILCALCAVGPAFAGYSLCVNVTQIQHLDWVRVSWTGLEFPADDQAFVGVYSPADVDVSTVDPLPYPASPPWTATAAVKYTDPIVNWTGTDGSGYYDFQLINMYEDVIFHLFTNGINAPKLLASSQTVSFASKPPLRAHLARTTDPTEMTVTWNSPDGLESGPTVRWGTQSGSYTNSAKATPNTYTRDDMCGAPGNSSGWFSPHWWNTAVITGLTPGQLVYFVYGATATNEWSEESFFRAAGVAAADATLNVVLVADMGMTELDGTEDHWAEPQAYETADHVRNRVATGNVDFVWHVGDLSYATGTESKWELFTNGLTGIADRVPYMIGLGNHESDFFANSSFPDQYYWSSDSGGECGIGATTRFPMPTPAGDYYGWYHFAQGPVTFIMLNSELYVDEESQQQAYLKATLQAVDRTVTPWVIVALHRPMYYSGPGPNATRDDHFGVLESVFMNNQVDVVITGHVHNAMVTCPVYYETCRQPKEQGAYDAPVHVVTGNAGQQLTPLAVQPDWIAYQAMEYGYATLTVNKTQLHMELHRDSDDSVHYEFDIYRSYPRK